uniref:Uncharacterized protein n=1 Tax=Oncorhynchus tshawytscha TaxID=74940 RepID=A0AAZ3NPP6_ONCTS
TNGKPKTYVPTTSKEPNVTHTDAHREKLDTTKLSCGVFALFTFTPCPTVPQYLQIPMEQWQFPSGYTVTHRGLDKRSRTSSALRERCPDLTWDCFRVGDSSMCFCGHHLYEHGKYTGSSVRVPCLVPSCSCGAFAFMPSRPEEVGEPWVRGRPGFDSQVWRALCRCKHPHQQHSPRAGHSCRVGGCRCVIFQSSFLCASCDQHWEKHETFFETEQSRRKQGGFHSKSHDTWHHSFFP